MKYIWSITSKELRGFFNSAVALLFLATFLGVVLFTFFWVEKFFARNIADVRPMFEWLPLLLIFLVSALTMRLWSEEQKLGTIEILLTLPVPLHRLVIGKFLAGLILVAIALVMTIGLPITVSLMGDLDWGPVIGGYLGALLLAAAYLSIGLCISSITDNQIISLFLTAVACLLLYLPGIDAVANLFGNRGGEILRDIGTGSRFESIARGVIDLRDLAYYGGLVLLFLFLNTALLRAKRWSAGRRTAKKRWNVKVGVTLVLVNVVAANLWLAPVGSARADLTENNIYSLSPVTEDLLERTSEPLVVRGYFTKETHPLIAPLVPQIKDLLREYDVAGGSNVRVEFVDPLEDEEIEKEARESYGIESVPFQFSGRNQAKLVNAYFHVLIKYGDQYEVLSFQDLIDVKMVGMGDVDVQIGNLEYNVTRTIKKVVYGFQSMDHLFASLSEDVKLTAYVTPDKLPEELQTIPGALEEIAASFEAQGGDKFAFETVEPNTQQMQKELYEQYGFQPFATSMLSNDTFYLHMLLQIGDRTATVPLPEKTSKSELEKALTEALERAAPGFVKTIGLVVPPPVKPPQNPMMRRQQRPRPPQNFSQLKKKLEENYNVKEIDPTKSDIPPEIDAVVLAGPDGLGEPAVRRIDQFLMRGGGVIALAGRYRLDINSRNLSVAPVTTGLEEALSSYGIEVPQKLVLDDQNDSFPVPVTRNVRGLQVQEVKLLPYPFFATVRQGQMAEESAAVAGIRGAIMHWASPVEVTASGGDGEDGANSDGSGADSTVLFRSSEGSWVQGDADVRPDFTSHPQTGFGKPEDLADSDTGPFPFAVTRTGRIPSHFATAPGGEGEAGASGEGAAGDAETGESGDSASSGSGADEETKTETATSDDRLIERSVPDARLAVVGSSSFASDEILRLAQRTGSKLVGNNLKLVQNLVDWAVTDTELLSIRSGGGYTRVLEVPEQERSKWEWINYGIVILLLLAVVGFTTLQRRTLVPMPLVPPKDRGGDDSEEAA